MILLGLIIAWAVIVAVLVAYEMGIAAGIVTAVAAGVLWFVEGINLFAYVTSNPLDVARGLGAWMLIGFVWSTFRFVVKLRKARNRYVDDKASAISGGTPEQAFIERVRNSYTERERYAPTVNNNKSNIMFWAWWWPFSMIAYIFEDMIRELWNASWRAIKAFFERIRSTVLGEAARDLD
jgi:hypothetical protein